ncbi:MAG: acyl-CoA dehydrogenase family protein [Dehalococcoidia bacterium]|nr:acyl-CoA dehydrogenase family protein [Dehalococcoidia bacterium]
MAFEYSDRHEAIRKMVRDFAEKEVRPGAGERDRASTFDNHLLKRMGDLGIMGMRVPEEYGGANADCLSLNLACEEIGRIDSALAWTVAGAELPGTLARHINNEQKERWRGYIEGMVKGEILGSLGITEPGAGSHVPGIQTTAVLEGDHWVINGTKQFITAVGLDVCKFTLCLCLTNRRPKEFTLILVPKGTPGFTIGTKNDLIGFRGTWNGEIHFDDCRVPVVNTISERGRGFQITQDLFHTVGLTMCSQAIGLQQGCYEEAAKYAKERKAFGQRICEFQYVQGMLVEMDLNLTLSRLLRNHVVGLVDQGKTVRKERAMLKWFTTESALLASRYAVSVFGGIGVCAEYPVSRLYRDARVANIAGGTTELEKTIVARWSGFLKEEERG